MRKLFVAVICVFSGLVLQFFVGREDPGWVSLFISGLLIGTGLGLTLWQAVYEYKLIKKWKYMNE